MREACPAARTSALSPNDNYNHPIALRGITDPSVLS